MSFVTMNAASTPGGGALTLTRGELSLSLGDVRLASGAVPPELIMGVRPEHTRLWRDGEGLIGPIAGRAEFVEMLGRETLIGVVTAGEQHFTVHADPSATVRPGETIRFGLEPGRLYLFDIATERALSIV